MFYTLKYIKTDQKIKCRTSSYKYSCRKIIDDIFYNFNVYDYFLTISKELSIKLTIVFNLIEQNRKPKRENLILYITIPNQLILTKVL